MKRGRVNVRDSYIMCLPAHSSQHLSWADARLLAGRLNDVGMMCATFAERDSSTGSYTEETEILLQTIARYTRLFHMLLYASVTSRFACLKTPRGLDLLVEAGAVTLEERQLLLESSNQHDTVLLWLSVLIDTAVADGRLSASTCRVKDASPIAVQMALQNKLVELRSAHASLKDELAARMPLAYVQLVQILTDGIILCTPVALNSSVGPFGVVAGTAVVTLWYSSIVTLAKLFLDPLSNEMSERGGDSGIGGIQVATLLQETNFNSERWRKSARALPDAAWRPPRADKPKPEAPESGGLMGRLFGTASPSAAAGEDGRSDGADAGVAAASSYTGGDATVVSQQM